MALFFQASVGETVWITFAYYDPRCGEANQNFRKLGWWRLDPIDYGSFTIPGPPFNAWNVDLRTVNRFAYFYATTANIASSWSGTGNGWLTVNPEARFEQCAFEDPGNSLLVNFNEIDFTWMNRFWQIDPSFDMVVMLWNYERKNRIQYNAQKGSTTYLGIGP